MQNFKISKVVFLKTISFIVLLTLIFSVFGIEKVQCAQLNNDIKCGDINEDGDINVSDGVVLKKHLANVAGITVRKDIGDVNVDNEVDVSDAVILMKYLAGMDVKLGEGSETPTIPEKKSKKLVVYFSATGTTKRLAEQTAQIIEADLYEIVPQTPYTSADLNYNDSNSRASREQNDDNARPAIAEGIQNIDEYDFIVLAYPIWHGQAPKIMSTFLESYDFSNKTILPFCTSGSSPIGNSAKNLERCCDDSTKWLEGRRLSSSISKEELEQWLNTASKEEEILKISFGQYQLEATFEDNSSADAFKNLLREGAITINMRDYGNFEKVGALGTTLPRNDIEITTEPGDVILYQGNSITIYYDTNTWDFTRLAKIKDSENLKEKLGDGTILVTFSLE